MRTTIYKCDDCKKEIGDNVHFSLNFSNYSGIAVPPGEDGNYGWCIEKSIQGKFLHFCTAKCLGSHFSKMLKGYNDQKKKLQKRGNA